MIEVMVGVDDLGERLAGTQGARPGDHRQRAPVVHRRHDHGEVVAQIDHHAVMAFAGEIPDAGRLLAHRNGRRTRRLRRPPRVRRGPQLADRRIHHRPGDPEVRHHRRVHPLPDPARHAQSVHRDQVVQLRHLVHLAERGLVALRDDPSGQAGGRIDHEGQPVSHVRDEVHGVGAGRHRSKLS
jgi:hypothetical protein